MLAERGVTVVVPTFHEAQCLPSLLDRLGRLRAEERLDLEVLLMDDRSRDGSAELVRGLGAPWVRFVERSSDPGLSAAVLDGFALATHPVVVVMDADLSHPPEAIPALLVKLEQGEDLVLGSRFVPGASVDGSWGRRRRLVSALARVLARPLTPVRDPGAGFLAFRRSLLERIDPLRPIGFKVGLELLVKARGARVAEVPIRFTDRSAGASKLGPKAQADYLRHLLRLYRYRLGRGRRRRRDVS